jgi:hypothetical protein
MKQKAAGLSMFKSKTRRFEQSDGQNPNVRILSKAKNQSADFGIYNISSANWKESRMFTDNESDLKVGFSSTSTRFNFNQIFFGQKLSLSPGPG